MDSVVRRKIEEVQEPAAPVCLSLRTYPPHHQCDSLDAPPDGGRYVGGVGEVLSGYQLRS